MQCVPVLISDGYVPPFSDVLNWKAFSVTVEVKDVPDIKKILMGISQTQYLRMHRRPNSVGLSCMKYVLLCSMEKLHCTWQLKMGTVNLLSSSSEPDVHIMVFIMCCLDCRLKTDYGFISICCFLLYTLYFIVGSFGRNGPRGRRK